MINKPETTLIEYFIAAFLGGILTGPGGMFLSTLIFFLFSRSKGGVNNKSKWALWIIFGIFPFVLTSYPSFVLSRTDIFTKEVKRSLNNQAQKCRISELDAKRMRSKISPGNALYKTYIPETQNECTIYKSQPRNFKSGLRSIFFWNRELDATWFQIEINQITGEAQKICGDSSKLGCNEGNTW
tara:strand:- start:492 stop:1043 length:552 start_codon:yes stop_codon:yes gene_type:complete